MDRFHNRLLKMQTVVAGAPEPLLAGAGWIVSRTALNHRLMDKYLADSGWLPA